MAIIEKRTVTYYIACDASRCASASAPEAVSPDRAQSNAMQEGFTYYLNPRGYEVWTCPECRSKRELDDAGDIHQVRP